MIIYIIFLLLLKLILDKTTERKISDFVFVVLGILSLGFTFIDSSYLSTAYEIINSNTHDRVYVSISLFCMGCYQLFLVINEEKSKQSVFDIEYQLVLLTVLLNSIWIKVLICSYLLVTTYIKNEKNIVHINKKVPVLIAAIILLVGKENLYTVDLLLVVLPIAIIMTIIKKMKRQGVHILLIIISIAMMRLEEQNSILIGFLIVIAMMESYFILIPPHSNLINELLLRVKFIEKRYIGLNLKMKESFRLDLDEKKYNPEKNIKYQISSRYVESDYLQRVLIVSFLVVIAILIGGKL